MARSINISGKKRRYEPQSGTPPRIRPAAFRRTGNCGFNNSADFTVRLNRLSLPFALFSNAARA